MRRVPRVEAEGGVNEFRVAIGEIGHGGPVIFPGAVDDAAADTGIFHRGDELVGPRGDSGVLKVEVGVEHDL